MTELALCISNDIPKTLKVNSVYNCMVNDTIAIISCINDKQKRDIILSHEEFEKCFVPLMSMDEAINLIESGFGEYNTCYKKFKRITGCTGYETCHETFEFFMRFVKDSLFNKLDPILHITQRGCFVDNKYICCDFIVTIKSDSIKINDLSFVCNLVPKDIKELVDTLKFLLS